MVEVIVIVTVLAVLVGVATVIMGDITNSATDNKRKTNAMTMNKQMTQIRALGGTIGEGAQNTIDTTSVEKVIDGLTKNPPLNVSGITFSLAPKPEAKEYKLIDGPSHKEVQAILTAEQ